MLGCTVNALLIAIASIFGCLIKNGIKDKYIQIITNAVGLSVLFVGVSSALGGLLDKNANPILFIVSLVVGSILGQIIDIEARLENLGKSLEKRFNKSNSNISQGFVTATLLFCIGTMAIIGSIESGISNNHSTLFAKSILDGVTSVILASTLGIGVIFSAVSVFIYEGLITLCASFLQAYITADIIREISIVGGILIFSLGLNMLGIKKIKVGNMLPAIIIPPIYYLLANLF